MFPSSNTDFSSEHIQKIQILFLKLLFPWKKKEKPKEMICQKCQIRTCGKRALDSSLTGLSWKDEDASHEVIQVIFLEWDSGETQFELFCGRFQLSVNFAANWDYSHSRQTRDPRPLAENVQD